MARGILLIVYLNICLKKAETAIAGLGLFEIVEESGETFESLLLLVLYLQFEFNLSFAYTSDVGNLVQRSCEAHSLPGEDWLAKFHLIHAIVDKHLDIVHLNDFLPEMG